MKEIGIADYNDIDYESDFWAKRIYEDSIEQYVLSKLLPGYIKYFIDIGGGFGRLAKTYSRFVRQKITIFDFSEKLLLSAKEKYGQDKKYDFVQGSFYDMPFEKSSFDGGCSVRVIHHVEDVDKYLSEISRVLKKDAIFVLEFANKRNLVEIIRKIFCRAKLNPFSLEPQNRSSKGLTYNFHPKYLSNKLAENGFEIVQSVDSSLFRSPFLKKFVGQARLAKIENLIPFFLRRFQLSPSVFLEIRKR